MTADPILNKAAILAKKKKYEEAVNILKIEEDRYYGSFKYYYLRAVINLYTGNFIEAKENFDLARKIKITDPYVKLGHAVLYLKRMNTVQAVNYYLEVHEEFPKNKTANKALSVIRKYSSGEALSDWLTSDKIRKLFPPLPSPKISGKFLASAFITFAAAAFVIYGALTFLNILPGPFKPKQTRPVTEYALTRDERNDPVEVDGFYRYILTRDEAVSLYDRAFSLFAEYRDESAKVNLNRIIESNASAAIKNRALLMIDNMTVPGFDNFKRSDNFSYSEVKSEPVFYRNVHVIWSGMATNIEVTDSFTRFDLLIGYETRAALEGIVPVVFHSPVAISADRPLEVLGRVTILNAYSDINLTGVAIHQSGRLE
ncbi:MAG: tetratricopeptide repeat protein [Treponema sp.]|nr:tetratricopeptide repeat protein [Treponema sp.]